MTIDEAIKIKIAWKKDCYPPPLADEINADNLAIEALKWRRHCTRVNAPTKYPPLPGETEEGK